MIVSLCIEPRLLAGTACFLVADIGFVRETKVGAKSKVEIEMTISNLIVRRYTAMISMARNDNS